MSFPEGNIIFGFDMNQNRFAVPLWDASFDQLPPKRVIELGSYNGGFTMALAFALWARGGIVLSWDRMEAPKEEWQKIARVLPVHFYRKDIFESAEHISALIQAEGTSYVLCDGGNKVREFNTFAKFLKPGDVIAAHDFQSPYWPWSEIKVEDVARTAEIHELTRWMPELEMGGWLAYRRKL